MATFTNQHQPTTGTFLSRLMAKTSAGAADVLRFVVDDEHDALLLALDDDNSTAASGTCGKYWNWRRGNNHVDTVVEESARGGTPYIAGENEDKKPVRDETASKQAETSTWLRDYLNPKLRDVYVADPHGRDAKMFCMLFRVHYDPFVDLVNLSKERWWCDCWTPDKVCIEGRLVSSLELKVLGAPYVLSTGAAQQHQVGVQTHLSKEVH